MWPGRIHYLTGGTTRLPRVISYDAGRWQRSIDVTRDVLAVYGVDERSKIAVCHPFAPWAIGMVFAEAALACGASVYPLGLYVGQPSFQQLLAEIEPTHLCATARNLIRWSPEGVGSHRGSRRRVAFVAGETLTDANRAHCAEIWNAHVVNVYGMAEFDTIAAELPGIDGLVLSDAFTFSIRAGEIMHNPGIGLAGELLIRDAEGVSWFPSGDLVQIVGRTGQESVWPSSWIINLLGRQEESATLSDGTMIGRRQISHVIDHCPEIARIQMCVRHSTAGDTLHLRCVPANGVVPGPDRVISLLLDSSIDIADSYHHGVITAITVETTSEDGLACTPRGKIPTFVEEETHETH